MEEDVKEFWLSSLENNSLNAQCLNPNAIKICKSCLKFLIEILKLGFICHLDLDSGHLYIT